MRAVLLEWQALHAARRLCHSFVPPSLNGTTWSTSVARVPIVHFLAYWQLGCTARYCALMRRQCAS